MGICIDYFIRIFNAFALQLSMHSPHRMHSEAFILPFGIIEFTSRLMGHFLEQALQFVHLVWSACTLSWGSFKVLPRW